MATRLSQRHTAEPAAAERRVALRYRVSIKRASVRGHGKQTQAAVLHDVSSYGCRITTEDRMAVGERLWVRLEGCAPIGATVVWAEDSLIGARFDTALDREVMRSLTLGTYPANDIEDR